MALLTVYPGPADADGGTHTVKPGYYVAGAFETYDPALLLDGGGGVQSHGLSYGSPATPSMVRVAYVFTGPTSP